jgi:hypothetical protein
VERTSSCVKCGQKVGNYSLSHGRDEKAEKDEKEDLVSLPETQIDVAEIDGDVTREMGLFCNHKQRCYCKRPVYNLVFLDNTFQICIEPTKCRSKFARKNVREVMRELLYEVNKDFSNNLWDIVLVYWFSDDSAKELLLTIPIKEKEKKKSSTSIKKVRMRVMRDGHWHYENVPESENRRRKITAHGSREIRRYQ